MKGSLARACQRWRCHGNSFYCYQSSTVWQVNLLIFYVSNDSLPGPDVYSSGITSEEQKIVSMSAVTGRLWVFKGALLRYRLLFTTKTWYFLPTAILHPSLFTLSAPRRFPATFADFLEIEIDNLFSVISWLLQSWDCISIRSQPTSGFLCRPVSTRGRPNPPRKNKRQTGDSVWLASWHHLCLLLFYQL